MTEAAPIENAVLDILSDFNSMVRTWVSPGQRLLVGRSAQADVTLRDQSMSGLHFRIDCERESCRIVDCNSSNGTYVNGEKTADVEVFDGDEIRAGGTVFAVRIKGGRPRSAPVESGEIPLAPAAKPPPTVEFTPLAYKTSTAQSALKQYSPQDHPSDAVAMLGLLTQLYPVYFVVHHHKFEQEIPETLEQPQYIMDWLPEAAARVNSPVLLPLGACEDPTSLMAQGWDKNGLFCVCSTLPEEQLIGHFRDVVRNKFSPDASPDGMLGFCWPQVVASILQDGAPGFVNRLTTGIEAVLVEASEPQSWQLFSHVDLDQNLDQFGFVQTDP